MHQRDRFIDGLRALAILGVVAGHWLIGALVVTPAGGLRIDSPMRYLQWLHPATWFLQMLGLFFLVGGYTAAQGPRRARARGETDAQWIRRRLWRIGRPVAASAVILAVALALLVWSGLSAATARTTVVLFLQPLWFMGVYAVITALTPYAGLVLRLPSGGVVVGGTGRPPGGGRPVRRWPGGLRVPDGGPGLSGEHRDRAR